MKVRVKVSHNMEARNRINAIAKSAKMQVGWFENLKYEDGQQVAAVAAQNEFGSASKRIPARPFMRPARDGNLNKWVDTFRRNIALTHYITNSLDVLGLVVTGDIRQAINQVYSPPLSPMTIAYRMSKYKGNKFTSSITKPLIDTALMISSVTHKTEVK